MRFQFTRPAWGATRSSSGRSTRKRFQFTRPAWGATGGVVGGVVGGGVSIHAPRMGRDFRHCVFDGGNWFQFTRPAWGATDPGGQNADCHPFQFTRPAWGATGCGRKASAQDGFQFTRPAWGATASFRKRERLCFVSIHAPRMGRDIEAFMPASLPSSFNSRAPHGARPMAGLVADIKRGFNSRAPHGARRPRKPLKPCWTTFQFTRPAWGATIDAFFIFCSSRVSIHAPRMGRDQSTRHSRR